MQFPSFFNRLRDVFKPAIQRTGKLLRPIAWPIIKAARQFGLGYKTTRDIIVDIGLAEPGTKFYDNVTADEQMLIHEEELRALRHHEIPGFDMLTEYDFGRAEHYKWIVKILGVNRFTNEPIEQFISIYTDELMSGSNAIQSIDFSLFEGESGSIIEVLNWEIYAIQHNPGAPYGAL